VQLCQHDHSRCTLRNAACKLCILLDMIYTGVLQGERCSQRTKCTRQLLLDRTASVECKLSRSDTVARAGNKTSRNIEQCYQCEKRQMYHVQQDSAATLCIGATGNEEEAISDNFVWSACWLCDNKACKAGTGQRVLFQVSQKQAHLHSASAQSRCDRKMMSFAGAPWPIR